MALRSVLRKMPALGLRSPPLVGPVRALSPAAGSRPMSHGAVLRNSTARYAGPLAQQIEATKLKIAEREAEFDRKWAEQEAEFDRKRAELHRKWAERERIATEQFDKNMKMIDQGAAEGEVYYEEITRRSSGDLSKFMKNLDIVWKTCNVLDVAFPAAALLVWISTMKQ